MIREFDGKRSKGTTRTPGHDYTLCDDCNVGHLVTHPPVIENFGHIWRHADSTAFARLGETRVSKLGWEAETVIAHADEIGIFFE